MLVLMADYSTFVVVFQIMRRAAFLSKENITTKKILKFK